MSGTVREDAYARLAATRPRPALPGDPLDVFSARFTRQGGVCARLPVLDALPAHVAEHFGAPLELILPAVPGLGELAWEQAGITTVPARARPLGALALASAFAGVAETGSLAVHVHAGTPMGLHFLPERLLIVIEAAAVLAHLEDFWACVRARFGTALPRGICLVSGPSSTADIAMSLTIGAHGPVEVHALIVG